MKRLVLAEPGAVGDGSAPEPPGALRSRGEEDGRGDGLPAPQETFCPRLGMGKSRGPGFTAREEARHRQCLAPSLQTGPAASLAGSKQAFGLEAAQPEPRLLQGWRSRREMAYGRKVHGGEWWGTSRTRAPKPPSSWGLQLTQNRPPSDLTARTTLDKYLYNFPQVWYQLTHPGTRIDSIPSVGSQRGNPELQLDLPEERRQAGQGTHFDSLSIFMPR